MRHDAILARLTSNRSRQVRCDENRPLNRMLNAQQHHCQHPNGEYRNAQLWSALLRSENLIWHGKAESDSRDDRNRLRQGPVSKSLPHKCQEGRKPSQASNTSRPRDLCPLDCWTKWYGVATRRSVHDPILRHEVLRNTKHSQGKHHHGDTASPVVRFHLAE